MDDLIRRSDAVRVVKDHCLLGDMITALYDLPAAPAAEGVTVTAELRKKIERLAKALIDMNITLCKYVADDDNLTPLQCEALRAAYMDEQVNACVVFRDLAAAGMVGDK